ncbi:MAG: glutamate--tRNA ligase [Candidatus Krumholzibacteriota bacterium]|nr:glutamate--tRNA ligase [Candidatus Krumholzibacteriota bacterium]
MRDVRVRFAPSPTGYLHVGGARTALFNWLFARHQGGKFIIRVEDTDRERSTGEFGRMLLEDLSWLGLDWDEGPGSGGEFGPYYQSERIEGYRREAQRLVGENRAYPCFCTDEELEEKREEQKQTGRPPQYDGTCRGFNERQREEKRKSGLPESIRFLVPAGEEKRIDDIARGEVVFPAGMVGDFVILRSNGLPTYNFAAAVDDASMRITHVIRGAEHLSNTLRQVMIYEALGTGMPRFAHIPLILGEDRTKLSKRHGAPNIRDYRERGYPAAALVNYLAFLGWSSQGDSEILTLEQLAGEFELERVSDSPSIFDEAKLNWISAQHIRAGGAEKYFTGAREYMPPIFLERYAESDLKKIFDVVSENLPCFSLFEQEARSFSPGIPRYGGETREKLAGAQDLLGLFIAGFEAAGELDQASIRRVIKEAGKAGGVKGKDLFLPLRLALTGYEHGPDLTTIISIRGKDEVLASLRRALREIQK